MRNSRLLIILAAGLLAACTKPAGDAATTADATKAADGTKAAVTTVATVNGKQLSSELLDVFVKAVSGGAQEPPSDEQKGQMLDQLINMTLAAQSAEKDGLAKDSAVQARLDLLRTQILAEAASEKFVKANPISEQELKTEYDTQVAAMPKEYKARHILVEKKETAESIIRELQAVSDPAKLADNFAKLAEKESKDSSGKSGGDLGWFSPQTMVKPFADAIAALEKGKYTLEPVQSEFGFHVILLEDVRSPEVPAFDQVKPQVEMFAQRKKLQTYIDGLRAAAKIQK
jgi:peptidyl-prolyl cis-trans isomerase C